jgi:hypothetical protein
MNKSRIQDLETRMEVLTLTLQALLDATGPEVRERVAHGLQAALGTAAGDDTADAMRAGTLWQVLRGTPAPSHRQHLASDQRLPVQQFGQAAHDPL